MREYLTSSTFVDPAACFYGMDNIMMSSFPYDFYYRDDDHHDDHHFTNKTRSSLSVRRRGGGGYDDVTIVLLLLLLSLSTQLASSFVGSFRSECFSRICCHRTMTFLGRLPSATTTTRWKIGRNIRHDDYNAVGGRSSLLRSSPYRDDKEDHDHHHHDLYEQNRYRTDIRNFLTQRSMQSFQFLLQQCRDEATVHWLQKTYGFHNLESYHGTGGMNMTLYPQWDTIFKDLVQRPNDVVIIYAKRRGRGIGGWSKNNPYIKQEDQFVEFPIDILPSSLVTRIIAIREQIAQEWIDDISTLIHVNDMVLSEYNKQQASERIVDKTQMKQQQDVKNRYDDDDGDADTSSLDRVAAPDVDAKNAATSKKEKKMAYDRSHMKFVCNLIDGLEGSSSLRKGSIDLLSLLATQESIHRLLREYRTSSSSSSTTDNEKKQQQQQRYVSYEWLRQFYTSRIATHFDGNQEYGRSDDFLEELLLTLPSMTEEQDHSSLNKKNKNADKKKKTTVISKISFIDPLRIAEDIIEMRNEVYEDWKDMMKNVKDQDHIDLRRAILTIQLEKTKTTITSNTDDGMTPPADRDHDDDKDTNVTNRVVVDESDIFQ